MTEQENQTPEEGTQQTAPAASGQSANGSQGSVGNSNGSRKNSGDSQGRNSNNRRRDDDYDDDDEYDEDYDYDNYEDEEESTEGDDEIREIRTSGPADYVPSTQRGRSRRIRIDVNIEELHYKNVPLLTRFLDPRGRILSRRKTGVSAKIQRRAVTAIKQARHLALLPYTAEHTRVTRLRRRSR